MWMFSRDCYCKYNRACIDGSREWKYLTCRIPNWVADCCLLNKCDCNYYTISNYTPFIIYQISPCCNIDNWPSNHNTYIQTCIHSQNTRRIVGLYSSRISYSHFCYLYYIHYQHTIIIHKLILLDSNIFLQGIIIQKHYLNKYIHLNTITYTNPSNH